MSDSFPTLDIVGIVFLILALAAFLWSLRRREFSVSDEEASRVLLAAREDRNAARSVETLLTPAKRKVVLAVFLTVLTLMAVAPVVTVLVAEYAVNHQSHGYTYPNPK